MSEMRRVRTHFIVTDVRNKYDVNWCGKLEGADPVWKDDMPVFIIQAEGTYMEVNTWDMKRLEKICKDITHPRGRGAIAKDQARIYLKQKDGSRLCMGTVTHRRIKSYAPMYDRIEWRD